MRSQNIKHNSSGKVGGASCLLLILLTFLAINPIISSSAFAEEIPESGIEEAPDEANLPSPQADTPSVVSISFSPTSGSASLSPTTSAGQSAQIKVLATVNVQQSGGYSVYVKSNSQNLVGQKSSANIIPGMQGNATYANMPVNTWGYYAAEGSVIPDSATYKAISTTGNGDKIAENTSNKITSDTKTIALSFATKINDEKPADTYQNTVTMSVVSSPMQITFADQGITTMQQMTSAICDAVSTGQEAQLKDTRDGKYYWVSKLSDGKCWMTQNLDLDLNASTTPLTPATSDVSANWTPGDAGKNPAYTETTATSSTIYANDIGQRSWSLGNYRITNPNTSSNCGSQKNSATDCPSQFTAYTTPTSQNGDENAHYILGNHYQWNAATAGTGGTITSGAASSSICPKGWRMPTSTSSGEFQALVTALGAASDVTKLTSSPFYGVRGGYVNQSTDYLLHGAGNDGYYWSSTPDSNGSSAYSFSFTSTTLVFPSNTVSRRNGFSVRCVAR